MLLIGVSLTVALGFLLAFLWASSSGQYDDDYTPSVRMLFDDTVPRPAVPQGIVPPPTASPDQEKSPSSSPSTD